MFDHNITAFFHFLRSLSGYFHPFVNIWFPHKYLVSEVPQIIYVLVVPKPSRGSSNNGLFLKLQLSTQLCLFVCVCVCGDTAFFYVCLLALSVRRHRLACGDGSLAWWARLPFRNTKLGSRRRQKRRVCTQRNQTQPESAVLMSVWTVDY